MRPSLPWPSRSAAEANADERDLTVEGTTTKWNVGSFDPDSQLRSLIDALYLDVDQPYRLLEFLIDDGLHRVGEHMESVGELDVIALLDEAGSRSSAVLRHRRSVARTASPDSDASVE